MIDARYALVHLGRETEDEPARAIVIRSYDNGATWHDLVTCHPDAANEILDAFAGAENAAREREATSRWWRTAEAMRDLAAGQQCGCRDTPDDPCLRCAIGGLYDAAMVEQRDADGY